MDGWRHAKNVAAPLVSRVIFARRGPQEIPAPRRTVAFAEVQRAVSSGRMELVEEWFARVAAAFPGFEVLASRTSYVSYDDNQLRSDIYAEVRRRFESHRGPDGVVFHQPLRVELLRHPEA